MAKQKITELRTGAPTKVLCDNPNCKRIKSATCFFINGKEYCCKQCVIACENVYDDSELWN